MTDISPVISAIVAFIATAVSGVYALPVLKRLKFGQTILEDGPQWHQKKQGTPTMGGIIMIFGVLVALCAAFAYGMIAKVNIFSEVKTNKFIIFLASVGLALFMGIIGFLDDYIKVVKKRNLGLTARQKLIAQLLVATAFAVAMYLAGGHVIKVPFFGPVDFGFWYIPFCIFVIIAMSNAANLTDAGWQDLLLNALGE